MRVSIESSTETSLEIQSDVLGKLLVPLDGILGLIFAGQSQAAELDPLWEQVRAEPRTTEVVWLANGDRLAGGFLGLDESKIKIQVSRQARRSRSTGGRRPRFRPEAGQLSSAQVRLPRAHAQGRLAAGCHRGPDRRRDRSGNDALRSRHQVFLERAGARAREKLVGRVSFRAESRSAISIFPMSGRLANIASIARSTAISFIWEVRLTTAGLARKARPFWRTRSNRAIVAFRRSWESTSGPGRSAAWSFACSSTARNDSRRLPMTDHDPPRPVDVDLAGAKYLILATEFGDRGDVRDLADWVEARMIR